MSNIVSVFLLKSYFTNTSKLVKESLLDHSVVITSNHEKLGEIIIIFLFQAQQCYQANINYSVRTGRGLLNNFADENLNSFLKSPNLQYVSSNRRKSIISLM